MPKTLQIVAWMALVTWLTILVASMIRARGWTWPGLLFAFGNRDNPPDRTSFAGRAERTAANTLENFVLFAALALSANAAGRVNAQVELGAQIFLWSRLAYISVYYAGIAYLRTAVWGVGVVGMAMIFVALL